METKTYIWIGIIVGGGAGGYLGSLLDNGNIFGAWGIFFSSVGSIAGIFIAYKLSNS